MAEHCKAAWQSARHPDFPGMSIAEAHAYEPPPMPSRFDGYVEVLARVSSTCLVTVKRNRYSVPCEYAGQRVSVRLYPEHIVIGADAQIVADHVRSLDRDQAAYDWRHYVPLLERKPGALRNGAPAEISRRPGRTVVSHPGGASRQARLPSTCAWQGDSGRSGAAAMRTDGVRATANTGGSISCMCVGPWLERQAGGGRLAAALRAGSWPEDPRVVDGCAAPRSYDRLRG